MYGSDTAGTIGKPAGVGLDDGISPELVRVGADAPAWLAGIGRSIGMVAAKSTARSRRNQRQADKRSQGLYKSLRRGLYPDAGCADGVAD